VLEVTKFDEGKIRLTSEEGVGLETLVEETFSLVQHLAFEKSIELVSEVGEVSDVGGKVVLDVDRTRMQQVFNNLVMNAVKYSPNNTKVTLLARSSRQKGLEIIVRDEGVGIPEESFATIFEPFQRLVDPEAGYIEGSGLGLSMVKSIVELHGGRVRVESEVQRGSSFIVQLPSSRVKLVQS
jgi:signal transduction histidine kinase